MVLVRVCPLGVVNSVVHFPVTSAASASKPAIESKPSARFNLMRSSSSVQ
jgi:hypothetical protein